MAAANPLEPISALAGSGVVLLVLVAWGAGEAILLPIVPDVLIGLLALASPDRASALLGAAVLGGVAGAEADWWLVRRRTALVDRLLAWQPALGRAGIAAAERRLRDLGLIRGFAQLGPGLPLKAYLRALRTVAPASTIADVAGLAVTNRLARLGPVTIGFVLLNPVEATIRWPPGLVIGLYTVGWAIFYPAYWIWRDPRRRD